MRGVDILVLANTGTAQAPVFTAVGSQRGAKLSEKNDIIETTVKPAAGAKRAKTREYGFGEWSISCDGLYVPDDAALTALRSACRDQEKVKVRWSEENGEVREGTALVASTDLDGPYDGDATYAVELQGDGAIVDASEQSAGLTNLAVSDLDGVLSPAFAQGKREYNANVLTDTASLTVTPTAAGCTIKVNGVVVVSGAASAAIPLADAAVTNITIEVTEPDHAPVTYVVHIARP